MRSENEEDSDGEDFDEVSDEDSDEDAGNTGANWMLPDDITEMLSQTRSFLFHVFFCFFVLCCVVFVKCM